MEINQGIKITRDFILDHIQESAIFERYLNLSINQGISYVNPLRTDKEAGCRFYVQKNTGRLKFNDFSRGKTYDCFDIVQQRFGLSFAEARDKIAKDFGLTKRSPKVKQDFINRASFLGADEKFPPILKVATRPFSKKEIEYWKSYHITGKQLKKFNVFAISKATFHRGAYSKIIYIHKDRECAFAYFIEGEWKLYFPERRSDRFYQMSQLAVQGYEQLPKTGKSVVITKSYKDVIGFDIYGIPAVAPQSENIKLKNILIDDLKRRFDNTYILYDNDWAGMRAMVKRIIEYPELIPLLISKGYPKDLTDNLKKSGVEYCREIINKYIK